ncbi:LL-diaminopimelate aminotransferase [Koleobacter methoxysyntrophicus]|uniref:Aminotransferase n=1 Tax=Koleobacter methoxysyntrophicus TaxID=2751313 RepID=A0A8A0RS73_9FIRM|nr:LL-diaminopimelate aminotransferase [Koleobacter methoxysyntrophicus]
MEFSSRMKNFRSAVFAMMKEKKEELLSRGRKVVDLSVGAPDMPPAPHIIEVLKREISDDKNYVYAISDLPELLDAAACWYKRRFGVELNPKTQISSLIGSQDGLAHISLTIVDPGDTVLVPDPGYPIFSAGPLLAGARIVTMPLKEEKGFLIDLDEIPSDVAAKAKFMIVSYPNNPVTAIAPPEFYRKLIDFAKEYDIIVLHDNAYCELTFDGYKAGSFLSFEGALEIGVEFNSLSKTYNMAGCRVGFALGNEEIIRNLKILKSNMDYGIFLPIQKAAIAALEGPQEYVKETALRYQKRRDILVDGLNSIGWKIRKPPATMFVWAPIPEGFSDSMEFTLFLLEKTGVAVTPGSSFGERGKRFVRIALVQPEEIIEEALALIKESNIF